MSHALPALPAPFCRLDAKRIAATSGVIALHLAMLMVMFVPLAPSAPPRVVEDPPYWLDPPIVEIPEIVPPPEATPRETVAPTEQHQAQVQAPDVPPLVFDDSGPMDIPAPPVAPVMPEQTFEPAPPGPLTLAVLHSPAPPYPGNAIRRELEGRVVLLIVVDATGRPVSGEVESSSGFSLLDRAALRTVLEKWRFEPARRDGLAVAATARVPIVFRLDR